MNHHQNVIQFNKIQKTFIQINLHFWKNIYLITYVIENLKNQLTLDKYQ
jgi:hypothetical protein